MYFQRSIHVISKQHWIAVKPSVNSPKPKKILSHVTCKGKQHLGKVERLCQHLLSYRRKYYFFRKCYYLTYVVQRRDRLVTCQLPSAYTAIPALGAERVSRVPIEYCSLIGVVGLDELVTPVARLASANQRPSHHLARDVLTSTDLWCHAHYKV